MYLSIFTLFLCSEKLALNKNIRFFIGLHNNITKTAFCIEK